MTPEECARMSSEEFLALAVGQLAEVIGIVVAAEREACAVIAETAHARSTPAGRAAGEAVGWDMDNLGCGIAAAIRARGEQ